MRVADNRDIWREFGKAYIQQWSVELKFIDLEVIAPQEKNILEFN